MACKSWSGTICERRAFPASGPWIAAGGMAMNLGDTWQVRARFTVIEGDPEPFCTGELELQMSLDGGPWMLATATAPNPVKSAEPDRAFPDIHNYVWTWTPFTAGAWRLRALLRYAGEPPLVDVFDYPSNILWDITVSAPVAIPDFRVRGHGPRSALTASAPVTLRKARCGCRPEPTAALWPAVPGIPRLRGGTEALEAARGATPARTRGHGGALEARFDRPPSSRRARGNAGGLVATGRGPGVLPAPSRVGLLTAEKAVL